MPPCINSHDWKHCVFRLSACPILVNAISQPHLEIFHKRSLVLKDELIRFWWSKCYCDFTSILSLHSCELDIYIGTDSRLAQTDLQYLRNALWKLVLNCHKHLIKLKDPITPLHTNVHGWIYKYMSLERHAGKLPVDCLRHPTMMS